MPNALRARALWKSYAAGVAGCSARIWVLRGASLVVERGECVALLGARGAGTTTLLQCLAGFRRVDAGSVEHGLVPHLVSGDAGAETHAFAQRGDGLLLCDDEHLASRDHVMSWSAHARRRGRGAVVIATHELARVRGLADRVLILREGRLIPIDQALGVRRVAERVIGDSSGQSLTSDMRAPARPGTVRA